MDKTAVITGLLDVRRGRRAAPQHQQTGTTMVGGTLNTMADLRRSGFGRHLPRHGLKLLFWFAKNYIKFDYMGEMVARYNPNEGGFDFHPFQNRPEWDCSNVTTHISVISCNFLLPDNVHPYYIVGNLNPEESNCLPQYVRKDFTGDQDDSNMDRLIISLRPDGTVDNVYVTQHDDDGLSFDPDNTYRVTRGLLRDIRGLKLHKFLKQAGYSSRQPIIHMNDYEDILSYFEDFLRL
ncbi:uncharacterized protein LOC115172240 isoform X1 [Salmo trutta]|uniref:Uncharacterized LOC115172240 n=1 Tax=Salmo trutta TaxID=8032 RepID=A0A674BQW6_SALTR|nr:uncharacterized protein LOC115172240 isoform X1 [Salmo trutta]